MAWSVGPRSDLSHDNEVIPAIVLAAGLSSRIGGRTKALLSAGTDTTFLGRIVQTFGAAGVTDIVVVAGHEADRIVAAMANEPTVRVVINADFASGQLSSLLAGLSAVDRPDVDALLLTLVDVPLVSSETVRAVVQRYHETHAPIVRPVRGDVHGHPVLIDRSLFAALRAADPERGAKPVVRAHVSPAGNVEVDDDGAFADVDTRDDYERLIRNVR